MEGLRKGLLLSACVSYVLLASFLGGAACDVPDDVVYTDLHRNVRIGDSVVLKCQFRGTPFAVHWKKGNDPIRAPRLVSWMTGAPVTGLCVGERLCQIMEMNGDHALVIKEVNVAEQGRYICRVKNDKGKLKHNFTEISVFSPPNEPYPFINECLRSPDIKSNQTCVISTAEDSINISCTASGYFPDLDLFFLCGSQSITIVHSEETTNRDGKKIKSITIQASPRPESYMCVASHIPGVAGQSAASLLVTTASVYRSDSTLAVKIGFPLIVIAIVFAVILGVFIRRHIRQQESTAVNHDDNDDPGPENVHRRVNQSPNYQNIRQVVYPATGGPALAGEMEDEHHSPLSVLMGKSLCNIRHNYKSERTDVVTVPFRPSRNQGNTRLLSKNAIAAGNEDKLRLHNYDLRRRLHQTADEL